MSNETAVFGDPGETGKSTNRKKVALIGFLAAAVALLVGIVILTSGGKGHSTPAALPTVSTSASSSALGAGQPTDLNTTSVPDSGSPVVSTSAAKPTSTATSGHANASTNPTATPPVTRSTAPVTHRSTASSKPKDPSSSNHSVPPTHTPTTPPATHTSSPKPPPYKAHFLYLGEPSSFNGLPQGSSIQSEANTCASGGNCSVTGMRSGGGCSFPSYDGSIAGAQSAGWAIWEYAPGVCNYAMGVSSFG